MLNIHTVVEQVIKGRLLLLQTEPRSVTKIIHSDSEVNTMHLQEKTVNSDLMNRSQIRNMMTEPPNAQVSFENKKHHLQRPASERGCGSQTMGKEEGKLVRD